MKSDWSLAAAAVFLVAAGAAPVVAYGVGYTSHQTLESAQAAFERDDPQARLLNWDGFRKEEGGTRFRCRSTSSIRACTVMVRTMDPFTREDSGSRMYAFTCSVEECVWLLDPGFGAATEMP